MSSPARFARAAEPAGRCSGPRGVRRQPAAHVRRQADSTTSVTQARTDPVPERCRVPPLRSPSRRCSAARPHRPGSKTPFASNADPRRPSRKEHSRRPLSTAGKPRRLAPSRSGTRHTQSDHAERSSPDPHTDIDTDTAKSNHIRDQSLIHPATIEDDLEEINRPTTPPATSKARLPSPDPHLDRAPGSIGIVQKSPDGAMPGSKSCTCCDGSPDGAREEVNSYEHERAMLRAPAAST